MRHAQILDRTQLTGTSLRCIQVIAGVLGRAGEAGQKKRLEAAAKGHITYEPAQGLTIDKKEKDDKEEAEVAARTAGAVGEAELDADAEMSRHLDEVRDGEDHRQKGGRSIKFSD